MTPEESVGSAGAGVGSDSGSCGLPVPLPRLPNGTVARVGATPAAVALIERLAAAHGPLLFHQSGGCCDGSAPMCFARGEFKIGERDVYLGDVGGAPFFISGVQFPAWSHTQLVIDVVAGRGASFSLEIPLGVRFLTRSRVFTRDEAAALAPLVPWAQSADGPFSTRPGE